MSGNPAQPHLRHAMGTRDVTLLMVTACCSPQWAALAAAAGPSSLAVWVIGGLTMFVPIAVCVVFLSSRHPDEGGLYVWSKLAFGPAAGFMTGWLYWIGATPFITGLLYFAAGSTLYLAGSPDSDIASSPAWFIGFSLVTLALVLWLNIRGLGVGKWLHNAGAVARWIETLLLLALGIAIFTRFGPSVPLTAESMTPGFRLHDWIFWGTIAFAWTGAEAASFMGGEIRDAQRTIPRALALAAPMIAAVYLLSTASIVVSVDPASMNALFGVMEAIRISAERLGVAWLIPLGAALVIVDRIGGVGLWIGAGARIPFVAGLDRFLPAGFGRVHPRFGSPVFSLCTLCAMIALLAVIGQAGTTVRGAYNVLVDMMVIGTMLPFLALFGSAIRLSGGRPVAGEARIPGGRATIVTMALVGLATTIAAIGFAFVPKPGETHPVLAMTKLVVGTAALIGIGALIYVVGSARARRSRRAAAK